MDALYLKVRQNHRIVSLALVIAVGVDEAGERHLLGFDLGGSEAEAFWLDFLRSLVKRGVKTVQLVISDAHEGLKSAISQVFSGASWQRCRVHFMRNLLAKIPHRDKAAVADAVRLIFDQPSLQSAQGQLRRLVEKLDKVYPDAANCWTRPSRIFWLTSRSPKNIGAGFIPPTCWSGSTRRSSAEPK